MHKEIPYRKDFIHHQTSKLSGSLREVVFGAEDGMVSTLGALTGIAIGTSDQFTIILAGLVIVAVESTGMSVGSYLSNKSVKESNERKLKEEREEIEKYPKAEKEEMIDLFEKDGWPRELSLQMAAAASQDKKLMLREMAYRELDMSPGKKETPLLGSFFMFFSYVVGGSIPLLPYFFLPINQAIGVSIIITLIGLFSLGVLTTKFTKRNWFKAGTEMLLLASVAAFIGYVIGRLADFIK